MKEVQSNIWTPTMWIVWIILALIYALPSVTFAANVNVMPSPTAEVIEGDTLWLTCTYELEGETLLQLVWTESSGGQIAVIFPTVEPPLCSVYNGYNMSCNLVSNSSTLGIINPVHGDNFTCYIFTSDSQPGDRTQVYVVVPVPSVEYFPPVEDTVTLSVGDTVTYTCVTGLCRPAAEIAWYRNGKNITALASSVSAVRNLFRTTSSVTLIGAIGDSSVSIYCAARNVNSLAPVTSSNKTFIVQWPPDGAPTISGYTETTILYLGDTIILYCTQSGGNPLSNLTWAGVCGHIPAVTSANTSATRSTITINVSEEYNQKMCICRSSHPKQQNVSSTQVIFTVYYPPSTPSITPTPTYPWLEETFGTLRCTYNDGFPTSTRIEWFRDGRLLEGESSDSIMVNPLMASDNNATYMCRVGNEYTDVKPQNLTSQVSILNVEYKPIVTSSSTYIRIEEGKDTIVDCSANGNPLPNVTWLHGSTIIEAGSGTSLSLILTDIDRTTTSNYTCHAESVSTVHGRLVTEELVVIQVLYPPTVSVEIPDAREGDTAINIRCVTKGEPNNVSVVSWTQSIGQTIIRTDKDFLYKSLSNDTIVIPVVSFEDTGTYTCIATNGIADRQGRQLQTNSTMFDIVGSPKYNSIGIDNTLYGRLQNTLVVKLPFYSYPRVNSKSEILWVNLKSGEQLMETENVIFELNNTETVTLSLYGITVEFVGQAAIMTLSPFIESMVGNYSVTVYNDGRNQHSTTYVFLLSYKPPDAPFLIGISNTTVSTLTFTWKKGFNGGHSQAFVILYQELGASLTRMTLVTETHESLYTHTVGNLNPNTWYNFIIYSRNEEGNSSVGTENEFQVQTKKKEVEVIENSEIPNTGSIILMCIGSLLILGFVVAVLTFRVLRRRSIINRRQPKEDPVDDVLQRSPVGTTGKQYEDLNMTDIGKPSVYDQIHTGESDFPVTERHTYESIEGVSDPNRCENLDGKQDTRKDHSYINTLEVC